MNPQKAARRRSRTSARWISSGADMFPGLSGPGADARDGRPHGAEPHRLRPRQPHAGEIPPDEVRGCPRRDHRDRAQRFSQSGQQRPCFPFTSSAARWTWGRTTQINDEMQLACIEGIAAGPRYHQRRGAAMPHQVRPRPLARNT